MIRPGSTVLRTSSIYCLFGKTLPANSGKYLRMFEELSMVCIDFQILSVENSAKLGALTTFFT